MEDSRQGKGAALQHCIDQIQRQRAEHKHELQRLCNSGQEYRQRRRDKHGTVILSLIRIHTTVHGQRDSQKKARSSNHLSHFKSCGGNRCQKLLISGHISCVFQINQVCYPCQPQGVLSKYLCSGIGSGKNCIGSSKGSVVHGNRQHMMQSKGQQQTFQCTIDKRRQHRRGVRGIGYPHAERVDSRLYHRPDYRQNQGNYHGPQNHHQRYKTFSVEECQRVRKLSVIIIFIVNHAAYETGNDADEHAHIQGRRPKHRCKVAVYRNFLSKQRMGYSPFCRQHLCGHAKDRSGNRIDQNKRNDGRKGSACPFLCPGASDRGSKKDMQIVDDRPADILHRASDRNNHVHIHARHLYQLSDTDHQSGCRHDGNDSHQHLAQLLKEIKINREFLLFLFGNGTGCSRRFF